MMVQTSSSMSAIEASYERRTQEWKLQEEQAAKELLRLDQDRIGARLRVAIAKRELADHDAQLANARAVDAQLRAWCDRVHDGSHRGAYAGPTEGGAWALDRARKP